MILSLRGVGRRSNLTDRFTFVRDDRNGVSFYRVVIASPEYIDGRGKFVYEIASLPFAMTEMGFHSIVLSLRVRCKRTTQSPENALRWNVVIKLLGNQVIDE